MTERFESEIRQALDAKAYEVDVPTALATQTMERVAAVEVRQPLWQRWKARRDAKRMRYPVTGYPRWLIGTAAVAGAVGLVLIGTFVTTPRGGGMKSATTVEHVAEPKSRRARDADRRPVVQEGHSGSGDAVAGQVAGVVSAGDESVDAKDRSDDVEIKTGDASGTNGASQFVGLTAGSDTLVAADVLSGTSTDVTGQVASGTGEPQLVRSAEIRVAVEEFDDAWNAAHDLVADHEGKVVNLRTSLGGKGAAEGTLRIRVPSDELDPLITDLRRLGTLASLRTTGDDIAEQIDATKEKLRDQKTALDEATQRGRTSDAEFLQRDVKRLENKRKALEDKVEFSFVNATLYQDEAAARRGSSMIGTAARTSGRLALAVVSGALVVAGVLAPLALIAAAFWLVARLIRRRRES